MLKALIIGADAVCPDYIFSNPERYPNLKKMIDNGASASYSAFVQKGYTDSYWSEMNWSSIYTGLSPIEHQISPNNSDKSRHIPKMSEFNGLLPFWEVLNQNGYSVGLWDADCCVDPIEINGYVIPNVYEPIETPSENRWAPRKIQLCDKDKFLLNYLNGNPPARLYPKTLAQQGYTFEQLKNNPKTAWESIQQYNFRESLQNFDDELNYWFTAMQKTQHEHPVDVLYWFTPTTDLIAHCCMYCDDNEVLIEAYQMLDKYIGDFTDEFNPEVTIFLSDHGQKNFKELVQCSDSEVQRAAFAARDEVLWLKNGYIAFEARNGALLFTAHSLKGTFIISGKGVKHTSEEEMRTLDIYPTILEILEVKIPIDRSGYVIDIFDRPITNANKLLNLDEVQRQSIALIQTHAVNLTDIFLNEIYIENRFADITIIGEEKYREIFCNNPRVYEFLPFEMFCASEFDAVYCGFYNETSGLMKHIKIYGS